MMKTAPAASPEGDVLQGDAEALFAVQLGDVTFPLTAYNET